MSTISAAAVNELRKRTDHPLMDCKRALTEAGGDMEKAVLILRGRNKGVGDKRKDNETAEGRIGVAIDAANGTAAIVEMRCESAPSAKSDQFIALANDIAVHVAAHDAQDVPALLAQPHGGGTVQERVDEVVGLIREKMIVQRFTRLTGGVFGEYVHHDGTVGVLLQCDGAGGNAEALRDVCAHIAALNPQFMVVDAVPAATIEQEKALLAAQTVENEKAAEQKAAEEGKKYFVKTPQILEKINEGKLKTRLSEIVLTEQPMANTAKYPGQTVGQVLSKLGLKPKKYVRYKVGASTLR